jgi:iron complex outermembrane recepter protein
MRHLLPLTFFLLTAVYAHGQTKLISGTVKDAGSGETLIAASVVIQGTTTGVMTDVNGRYSIMLDMSTPKTLEFSFLGYQKQEIMIDGTVTELNVDLKVITMRGQEVVVSGSRVSETILESTASIQKMNTRDIQEVASGDFYSSLSTLQGVDITTSSLGFQAVNMRGFNTTAPVRVVQFVDGMDNQAPGLNFPIGNMVGANDLDLESVEVITGPASALYGPSAFQGVVSMTTKNPYDYQGVSAQLKGGSRNMIDGQFRFATTLGKEDRWGVKITGQYMRVDDWVANDPVANRYGDIETDVNLSNIIEQQQTNPDLTQEERDDFISLVGGYLGLVSPNAFPGTINVQAPGYMEADLADTRAYSAKASAAVHYRFNKGIEASYTYKFGMGRGIYQGANRYSLNNIMFQQHKVEVSGRNWKVRGYTTLEDAGDSYDAVFTGINISRQGISDYVGEYLGAYFDTLRVMSNDFDRSVSAAQVSTAHQHARDRADANGWIQTGTHRFDSLRRAIITNPNLERGSLFTDLSSLQHVDAQYNFDWDWMDVLVGANFRRYAPRSYGTIFEDTLVNRADTLDNGAANRNAQFVDISQVEFGGFIQMTKRLFDDKFKIQGSVRLDKNQNFPLQFSPRLSMMYDYKGHIFRVAGQSAFRSPTLQNQYIRLNLGPLIVAGNLNGWDNLYTLESVTSFNDYIDSMQVNNLWHDSVYDQAARQLATYNARPIRPEQVRTIEVGYRGAIVKNLYVDANFYYNWYTDFIGEIRVVEPFNAVAGEESGVDQLLSHSEGSPTRQIYQIPVNADQEVRSMGATLGLAYYIGQKYTASVNYTFARLIDSDLDDPIIPGFNTPEHKVNIGLRGRRVWKGLGFSANFQWVDEFRWESTFGDGLVPSYHVLDMQLSYEVPKWYSTFRLGATNIYNNRRIEAFGSPVIGAMVYGSILVDIKDIKNTFKKKETAQP